MRTKLGELIVSVTPSPAPKPFANWVLPAPRSPTRLDDVAGLRGAPRASRRARASRSGVMAGDDALGGDDGHGAEGTRSCSRRAAARSTAT